MTNYYMGQRVLFQTNLFGKNYFWMRDGDGVVYLARAKVQRAASVDAQTGKATKFVEKLVPDFS